MKNYLSRFLALFLAVSIGIPPQGWAQSNFRSPQPLAVHQAALQNRLGQEALASRVLWELDGAAGPRHEATLWLETHTIAGGTGLAEDVYKPSERIDNSPSAISVRIKNAMSIDLMDGKGELKKLDALRTEFIKSIFPSSKPKDNNEAVQQDLFRSISGIAVIPLLYVLTTHRRTPEGPTLYEFLLSGPKTIAEISHEFNPENPEANMGYKNLFLPVLAQQGWLSLEGRNKNTRYFLTPMGREIFALATDPVYARTLAEAVYSFDRSHDYYNAFRTPQNSASDVILKEYRALIDKNSAGWGFKDSPQNPLKQRAITQLRLLFKGVIVCPTMIALGKPQTIEENEEARDVSSFDEVILNAQRNGRKATVEEVAGHGQFNTPLLRAAFEFLAQYSPFGADHPLVAFDGQAVQFLEYGYDFMNKKGGYGVPTSYLRGSTARALEAILFNPEFKKVVDLGEREHVDQPVNAWGSHLQHVTFLPRLLTITLTLVEEGAPGVSEMACGDGNNDLTVSVASAAWIEVLKAYYAKKLELLNNNPQADPKEKSKIGTKYQELVERSPFVAITSDWDRKLFKEHRKIFRALMSSLQNLAPYIRHFTIWGDITDRAGYAKAVRAVMVEKGLTMIRKGKKDVIKLNDMVQLLMFGIEERDIRNPDMAPVQAERELLIRIRKLLRVIRKDQEVRNAVHKALVDMKVDLISLGERGILIATERELLELIRSRVNISWTHYGKLIPAEAGFVDLIMYMEEGPASAIAMDVCTTLLGEVNQEEKALGNVNYGFTHAFREKIFTEPQRRLAYLLAGYKLRFLKPIPFEDRPSASTVGSAYLYRPEYRQSSNLSLGILGAVTAGTIALSAWNIHRHRSEERKIDRKAA